MKMLQSFRPAVIFCGIFLFTLSAVPKTVISGYCDVVINKRAFNQTDSFSQANIYDSMRKDMCSLSWSNRQEFEAAARTSRIDIGTADWVFGFNDRSSGSSTSLNSSTNQKCLMESNLYVSQFIEQNSSVMADGALSAWSQCVREHLSSVSHGLFGVLIDGPDRKRFDIKFLYKTEGSPHLEIQAINAKSSETLVRCYEGSVEIDPSNDAPYPIRSSARSIQCTKDDAVNVMISINTNAGTLENLRSMGIVESVVEREYIFEELARLSQSDQNNREELLNLLESHVAYMKSEIETNKSNIKFLTERFAMQ